MSHCWTVRCKTCEKRCEEEVNKGKELLIGLIADWLSIRKAAKILSNLEFYRTVYLLPLLADEMAVSVEILNFIDVHCSHQLEVVSEYPNIEPVNAPIKASKPKVSLEFEFRLL